MSTQPTEANETAPQNDDSASNTANEPQEQQHERDNSPKPTETVEFWKAKAREQEKRAKSNASAAKRLSEIEDAQKTEAEKSAERISELEREAAEAHADALRYRVASKYGIDDDSAALLLTGSDEDTLTAQAEAIAARADDTNKKKRGVFVPDEGRGSGKAKQSKEDQFAEFLDSQLSH